MMARDAHGVLLRAVRQAIGQDAMFAEARAEDRQLPALTIEGLESEPWVSAMFNGQKHRLNLRIDGAAAELCTVRDRLTARLHGADIELPGHVLIDMALVKAETHAAERADAETCRMTFEALTVED